MITFMNPEKSSNASKHKGFVIFMKDSAVSERSCSEELKVALKLGEELTALGEVSNELCKDFHFA